MDRYIFLESATSTNDEAKRLGIEGAAAGTIVVAERQTSGRGRMGRVWQSPEGGLWASLIIRPEQRHIEKVTRISLAAGVAVLDTLDEIFSELSIVERAGLGWPNDVLVNFKKVAGILCEAHLAGPSPFVVVGMGINLNNSASALPDELRIISTSVSDLGGKQFSQQAALEKLTRMLDNRIPQVVECAETWISTLETWRERCVLIGREVTISSPGSSPEKAIATGIDSEGRLLVKAHNGEERPVEFEETTLAR